MTVTRKIGFYSLELVNKNDPDEIISPLELRRVINQIQSLTKTDKKRELADNKFYFLNEVNELENPDSIQTLVFSHAEHGRRLRLIHKDTLEERDNPKTLAEGDSEATHIALRYDEDEIILLLEEGQDRLTISRLIYYITQVASYPRRRERQANKISPVAVTLGEKTNDY